MTQPKRRDMFLAYRRDYIWYKPRERPLHERTISRYLRALRLVEKLIGHDLESVSDTDQLIFIERIADYKMGTRNVTTRIFQSYVAWGIKNGHLTCNNILKGQEDAIIGERVAPTYKYIPKSHIRRFFMKLKTPQLRMVFALVYYGALTTAEIESLSVKNITKSGLLVYRPVLKQSQVIPLPRLMMLELREYAETRDDLLFDLGRDRTARGKINRWYRSAQTETEELMDTTVRDLRTSGIRHFFELCMDIDQTKEFAGVPKSKGGWLDSLADMSSHYIKNINKARRYHGSAEK